MAFENIDVFEEVSKKVLANYGWQDECRPELIVLSENATYMIKNKKTGINQGVLRVSRPGYHTVDELRAEMRWLKEINESTSLIVIKQIAGLDGESIQSVEASDGNTYYCIMSEFLEGTEPDQNNEAEIVRQFEALGEVTAYLHRQSEMWDGAEQLERIDWNYENLIGMDGAWGRWTDFSDMTEDEKLTLMKVSEIIKRRLEIYGRHKKNYGLIHADLRLTNILFEGEQIKVIDFDDCGFGWHLYDLAASVSFVEAEPVASGMIAAWLKGYQKVRPLSDADLTEIDTFIMMRRLQLTAWMETHYDTPTAEENRPGWMEGTMKLAERYIENFA